MLSSSKVRQRVAGLVKRVTKLSKTIVVTNSINTRTVTLKAQAKACSIGSSKCKNLKLKKKRKEEKGTYTLRSLSTIVTVRVGQCGVDVVS